MSRPPEKWAAHEGSCRDQGGRGHLCWVQAREALNGLPGVLCTRRQAKASLDSPEFQAP